jgi:hypothetical protein
MTSGDTIDDVIIERVLTVTRRDGVKETLVVRLGRPRLESNAPDAPYYCDWQFIGARPGPVRRIFGEDALQALELTLKIIGVTLETRIEKDGEQIHWLDTLPHGFPAAGWGKDIEFDTDASG